MLSQHRSLRRGALNKSDTFASDDSVKDRKEKRQWMFHSGTLLSSHRADESFASSSHFVSPTKGKGRVESKIDIYNRTQRPWVIFVSNFWFHLPIKDYVNCSLACSTLNTLFVPTKDMLLGNNTLPRLHYAAYVGQLMKVKYLLYHGFLTNELTPTLFTPLHYAAQEGHLEIAKELILNGTRDSHELSKRVEINKKDGGKKLKADPNKRNIKKRTPLHLAAANGRTEMVKFLIQSGAEIEAGSADRKRTPLLLAAKYGHLTTVKTLVELGANKNVLAKGGLSCVHYAAKGGFPEMIEFLVKSGAVPELIGHTPSAQVTVLQYAISNEKADSVWKLVELGVNINQILANGVTPLHLAMQTPNDEFVKEIISMGANVNATLQRQHNATPLHLAAMMTSSSLAKILIHAGANIHAVTVGGYTPLHYAVMMMAEEVVKILIRANANVDAVSHCGWTPLHLAAFKGHKGIFLHLLANGANKHARIRGANTLVHLVVLKRNPGPELELDKEYSSQTDGKDLDEIINIILEDPVIDVSAKNKDGDTPLHIAIARGDNHMSNLLLAAGADLSIQNKEGDTVLHYAANKHNAPLVQTLVKQGAPLELRNANGITPFFAIHAKKLYKFERKEDEIVPIEVRVKQGIEDPAFSWTNAHKLAALSLTQLKRWMEDAIASQFPNPADVLVYSISTGKAYNVQEQIRLMSDVDALCSTFHSASFAHAADADLEPEPGALESSSSSSSVSSSSSSSSSAPTTPSSASSPTTPTSQSSLNITIRAADSPAPTRIRPISYASSPPSSPTSQSPPAPLTPSSSSSSVSSSASSPPPSPSAASAASANSVPAHCWLHKAAARGQTEELEKLIAAGENVNDNKLHGWTPIQVSVFAGQPETTFLLASYGANVRVTTSATSNTLLHLAVFRNRLVVAKTILELGWIQTDVTNVEGDTPLHIAAWLGYEDMVELLIKHKAHVSALNNEGNTALHFAAVCGHLSIVTKLMHYGAKPIVENRRGETPIIFASKAGRTSVEAALHGKK